MNSWHLKIRCLLQEFLKEEQGKDDSKAQAWLTGEGGIVTEWSTAL